MSALANGGMPGCCHRLSIVDVNPARPEPWFSHHSLRGEAEHVLGAPTHERELERRRLRLPDDGTEAMDQIPVALLRRAHGVAEQQGLGSLAFGDVERDPLEEQRPPDVVLDHARLAANPHHVSIAGDEPTLGLEGAARPAAAGELLVPQIAIVRVQLPVPEKWVLEPLLLRE